MKPVSKKSVKKPTKRSESKLVRIRFTMENELYEQAKTEADKLGLSFSKFVEQAVRHYIKINRNR